MKAIDSRIRRLRQHLIPDEGQKQRIWVMVIYGQEFALDTDRCVEILRECGFLPRTRWVVLYFCGIPDGLNAVELGQYLRTNGAKICGTNRDLQQSGPGAASRPGDNYGSDYAQMSTGVLR
jgi:hypothetical protein